MSNQQLAKFEEAKEIVLKVEADFNKLAKIHGIVSFEKEQTFAIQALKNNPYLCGVAYNNKDSLQMAVLNVAAVGLSLNPVLKQAYLVPRDGRICLDISYLGYIQKGVDAGSIKYAKAEIVHENDKFIYHGLGKEPTHEFEPFGDRGKMVGVYCLAVTHQGDYLTEMMPLDKVFSIRDRFSKSWQAHQRDKSKSTPWKDDEEEMIKKTVVRRAYKSWPMTNTKDAKALEKAVSLDDDIREVDVTPPETPAEKTKKQLKMDQFREMLKFIDRDEKKFCEFLQRVFQRKIERLEDLTDSETDRAEVLLQDSVNVKINKEGEKDENSEAS